MANSSPAGVDHDATIDALTYEFAEVAPRYFEQNVFDSRPAELETYFSLGPPGCHRAVRLRPGAHRCGLGAVRRAEVGAHPGRHALPRARPSRPPLPGTDRSSASLAQADGRQGRRSAPLHVPAGTPAVRGRSATLLPGGSNHRASGLHLGAPPVPRVAAPGYSRPAPHSGVGAGFTFNARIY